MHEWAALLLQFLPNKTSGYSYFSLIAYTAAFYYHNGAKSWINIPRSDWFTNRYVALGYEIRLLSLWSLAPYKDPDCLGSRSTSAQDRNSFFLPFRKIQTQSLPYHGCKMHCSIYKSQSDTNPTFSLTNMKEMPVSKAIYCQNKTNHTIYLETRLGLFQTDLFSEHTWIAFPQ